MALRAWDGFGWYALFSTPEFRFTDQWIITRSIGNGTGRRTALDVLDRCINTSAGVGVGGVGIGNGYFKPIVPLGTAGMVGIGQSFRMAAASSTWPTIVNFDLCTFFALGVEQVSIREVSSGFLAIFERVGGTMIEVARTATAVLSPPNTYKYIEFQVDHRGGPPSIASVYVNNTLVLLTSFNPPTTYTDDFAIGCYSFTNNTSGSSIFMSHDDVYVIDDNGSDFLGLLGEVAIISRYPASNGDLTQWTPENAGQTNFRAVSRVPSQGQGVGVPGISADGITDLYRLGTIVAPGPMLAVRQGCVATNVEHGCYFSLERKFAGVTVVGPQFAMTGANRYCTLDLPLNPFTSTPWTETDLLALQFGQVYEGYTP